MNPENEKKYFVGKVISIKKQDGTYTSSEEITNGPFTEDKAKSLVKKLHNREFNNNITWCYGTRDKWKV